MKNIILTATLFLLFSMTFVAGGIMAQTQDNPEANAKKYGVTFPIAELGNCANFSACKTYCDDATHGDQCIAFAKKKGFYKQIEQDTRRKALLQAARSELGCTSEEQCRAVCHQQENFEKCSNFAKKNGIDTHPQEPGNKNIIEKAQTILGCNSEQSCRAVCEQDANKEKCSEFAKQTGLQGGIRRVGPGGCNSEESCRAFCEKSPDECRKFGGGPPPGSEGNRIGPGGCNSEESCRTYCEKNPEECKKFGGQGFESGRKGPGGCDSEESCRKYCQEHPQECGGEQSTGSDQRGSQYQQQNRGQQNSEEFCRQNPDKCRRPEGTFQNTNQGSPPPADFCKDNPDKCREMQQNYQNQSPQGQFNPQERKEGPPTGERREGMPPAEQQNFQLPSQGERHESSESRPPEGQRSSEGQRPPDGAGQPPPQEVRGVSTNASLWENILNFLFARPQTRY